jgi:hypothetical protein
MRIALDATGNRIEATPKARAACPGCRGVVIAKCGILKVEHWAHTAGVDCDPWSEPETPWHAGWKSCFPVDQQEVVRGEHRADVVTNSGWVIELQHSSIDPLSIGAREITYDRMVWVIDAAPFVQNLEFSALPTLPEGESRFHFAWKWPRRSWSWATRPVYFDMRDGWLFRVHDLDCGGQRGGIGSFVEASGLISRAGGDGARSRCEVKLDRRCSRCQRNAANGEFRWSEEHGCCVRKCGFCGFMEILSR